MRLFGKTAKTETTKTNTGPVQPSYEDRFAAAVADWRGRLSPTDDPWILLLDRAWANGAAENQLGTRRCDQQIAAFVELANAYERLRDTYLGLSKRKEN